MGRPKLDIPTVMVRVSVETHSALAEMAKKRGCPIRELVEQLLEEYKDDFREDLCPKGKSWKRL